MKNNLDLSILDALRPAKRPQDERARKLGVDGSGIEEDAAETKFETPEGAYGKLAAKYREEERRRDAANKQIEVYHAYQETIKRSWVLMSEITKGITAGIDPLELLLTACELVAGATGDAMFYEQSRKNLIAIYGIGLLEPAPLQQELKEVRKRIDMLTRPELDAETEEIKARIRKAVKAHKERERLLQEKIAKHGTKPVTGGVYGEDQ